MNKVVRCQQPAQPLWGCHLMAARTTASCWHNTHMATDDGICIDMHHADTHAWHQQVILVIL